MLIALRVENLLLIEQATLPLAGGLNVVTGETGAGKTMLAHALDLLLGGKARPNIVRPGAREAYVEGIFALTDAVRAAAGELLPDDAEELVLARKVSSQGRTRALVCGRAVSVGDLARIAAPLIAFYGQHEHRRLTLGAAQLAMLDASCGPEQAERRARVATAWSDLREIRARRAELADQAGARERERDLLRFELEEIERIDPVAGEYDTLITDRQRARHVASLRASAVGAVEALSDAEDGAVVGQLAAGARALEPTAGIDAALDALAARWQSLIVEVDDVAAELRSYASGLDESLADQLEEIETRLAAIERLIRKHGGSLDGVLAHAQHCRDRVAALTGDDASLQYLDGQEAEAQQRYDAIAAELHTARRAGGVALGSQVAEALADLAMEGSTFTVELSEREAGPSGADAVEFLVAPNTGVSAAPLRDTASGGEMSRIMLALLSVAHAGESGTLVFDEIDAGIGGQTARAVGERLRELSSGRQVLCITHLPQVASLATRHFAIVKDPRGEPATTTVSELDEPGVIEELVRMLGADDGDHAAVEHAERLRAIA